MKLLKGCLLSLIIFILLCLTGVYFLRNNIINKLESQKIDVNQKWNNYVSILNERNSILFKQNSNNDSLKYYLEKSKSISSKENSKEFEYNEYKINKFIVPNSLISDLNNSLNSTLKAYNEAARSYNFYKIKFPIFLIVRKIKFSKNFKYFEIQYGIDNEETMNKKKKIENWIKNGGDYPY
ncbi:hypothetical protein [Flavobacterium sp. H4147]|uniref:hypothetical protein n=1 Tax=Flavobacterium sp. H4147 TaxID=3034149 RepID=UPI0023EB57A9|nr:hypothetical protein [Flavobacterium sp. H4147]